MKRTALTRRTPLNPGSKGLRRTELARVSPAKRSVARQRKQRDTGPSTETKHMLWERAHGRCERCGRTLADGFPFSRHHRRPRGMGGSTVEWINDITNLLLLCGSATTPDGCHAWVESHRAESYDAGWLIHQNSPYAPEELPVLVAMWHRNPDGRDGWPMRDLVYLTDDGMYAKGVV